MTEGTYSDCFNLQPIVYLLRRSILTQDVDCRPALTCYNEVAASIFVSQFVCLHVEALKFTVNGNVIESRRILTTYVDARKGASAHVWYVRRRAPL